MAATPLKENPANQSHQAVERDEPQKWLARNARSSNTPLFHRMREDMDLDAGPIAQGQSLQGVGEASFEFALRVASGTPTASELLGLGDNEFVPWTVGPTL